MTKSVLVTGASTGIGEACVVRLAGKGHRVYAGVRREVDGERLRSEIAGDVVPVILDVTDQAQIDAAVKQIDADTGELHGLVNNAGIARGGPIEYLPIEEWREQIEVNLIGPVALTKAALPLIRNAHGRVVFMGSIGGKVGSSMMGPYNASKFAIEGVGEALRHELRPWGISVSVIEPGAIKTAIWDKGRETADRLERDLSAEANERYAPHIAAIRKGIEMQDRQGIGPDKVAAAVDHALFSSRPKTRYAVGVDARVESLMVRLLPDRPREAIVRRFAGP